MSKACSPSLETAQRWSRPPPILAMIKGAGQLVRAATCIQEQSAHYSPTLDGFVCWAPKALPDEAIEFKSCQLVLNVISESQRASINVCSPESSVEAWSTTPSPFQSNSTPSRQESHSVQPIIAKVEADRHLPKCLVGAIKASEGLTSAVLCEGA